MNDFSGKIRFIYTLFYKDLKTKNVRNPLQPVFFFFSREPQKSGREHFHKSGREYFACAREYKNEKVPVNRKIAREQRKKCP